MRRRLGTVQDRVEENICPFLLGAGIRSISTPVTCCSLLQERSNRRCNRKRAAVKGCAVELGLKEAGAGTVKETDAGTGVCGSEDSPATAVCVKIGGCPFRALCSTVSLREWITNHRTRVLEPLRQAVPSPRSDTFNIRGTSIKVHTCYICTHLCPRSSCLAWRMISPLVWIRHLTFFSSNSNHLTVPFHPIHCVAVRRLALVLSWLPTTTAKYYLSVHG